MAISEIGEQTVGNYGRIGERACSSVSYNSLVNSIHARLSSSTDVAIFGRSSMVSSSFRLEGFSRISGLIRGLVQWSVEVYRW